MNWERLKLMRTAARVQRCHTMATNYRQSVGEHSFGLACLLMEMIAGDEQVENPFLLMKAAMYHDAPEAITGDTPAPAKWAHPKFEEQLKVVEHTILKEFDLASEISAYEYLLLKFCDMMELAMYAVEEWDMGNKMFATVAQNALNAIARRGLHRTNEKTQKLYDKVCCDFHGKTGMNYSEEVYHGWPQY